MGSNSVIFILPATLIGINYSRKEFAPLGANSILEEVPGRHTESHGSCFPSKQMAESIEFYQYILIHPDISCLLINLIL